MEFRIQRAEEKDASAVAEVIKTVWEGMDRKEWFAADDENAVRTLLAGKKGLGYLAIEEESGALAGIFTVAFPGKKEKNLGYDIGMAEELLETVAHMDTAAILPEYRGFGLQYRLMQAAEAELKGMGYRYLMCTVHPDNRYSRENIIRQGYRAAARKEKYGGFLRDIFIKELLV
jgi:ribosomal protein S18 acetylase RimI-like enzyme